MEFLTLAKSTSSLFGSSYSSSLGLESALAAIGLVLSMFIGLIVVGLAIIIVVYAAYWAIMKKAGKEGIDGIIPVHNEICLLEICGIPKWMWFLNLIPFGALAFTIILAIYMARSFGKTGGYAVGLIFLPFVFYPMLAWGSARYVGKTWGVAPQPQYQPQYQPQQQPNYQQPAQSVNPDGTFQQYQAPQQPQNPGNNVPPQQ